MWDIYDRPAEPALYDRAVETTWWINRPKAEALGKGI
jgi:hypothetical protein